MTHATRVRLGIALLSSVLLTTPAPAEGPDTDATARLLEAGAFEDARAELEEILAGDPGNGRAWYQLGIAQYELERYTEGAAAFARAAEHDHLVEFSWFNVACARALDGDVDGALDALAEAIEWGYVFEESIETDPDLVTVRAHPRFGDVYRPLVYAPHASSEPYTCAAADGHPVSGVFYRALGSDPARLDATRPMILLLHQSGSNHAEYLPIAPRLAAHGYHALALDLRGGSKMWGRRNETEDSWKEKNEGRRGGGAQAKLDIEGAISHLRRAGYGGKILLWGSSYTAGRLFAVQADNVEEIAATLSFSPPTGFSREREDGAPSWASRAVRPAFVTWTERELGEEQRAAFEAIASEARVLFVQEGGAHGSSTLRPDRNPGGCEAVWERVLTFLELHAPAQAAPELPAD